MQLQFEKQEIPCLRTLKREAQTQEQTQEFRISDGMPDVGSIIGAWGQPILRGKEWQSDGMSVNGGTMVWIQYQPEEGGAPQCVETWLPFQMRWSFPPTERDGTIFTRCMLRGVDARSISARKIMVRTNTSVMAWAMERGTCGLYTPGDVPEDVQLLTVTYPVQLPSEAGEKVFTLDETIALPPSAPKMENLIHYSLQPQITEEKLMGDKVVFRGNGQLHILYATADGGQYAWDFELPFTQYSELENEYGEDAQVLLWPCVTALEIDHDESGMHMKAGLVCQYRISHRPSIQVVEDAYSPRRDVTPYRQDLELPGILESKEQTFHIQQNIPVDAMRLMDIQFYPHPVAVRNTSEEMEMSGHFQMLYYDMEGILRSATQQWENCMILPSGQNTDMEADLWSAGKVQGNTMSGNTQLSVDVKLTTEASHGDPIPMLSGLELGELRPLDATRPSLILRKAEGATIWNLAKQYGSSVEAIRENNNLQNEPEKTQVLLIPIL